MFKGIIKYYFLYVFCILFVSSLFNFIPSAGFMSYAWFTPSAGQATQTQTSANKIDPNIIYPVCGACPVRGISLCRRCKNNSLDFNYRNFTINNPPEKVSSFKNKLVSQRPPHQTKLKETGKVEAKFLSANFSNSHNKELTHSKQTDKSNHCCFLI